MAQAVTQLYPGAKFSIGPGHRGRLLLRLRSAGRPHLPRGGPGGHRVPHAGDHRRRSALRARRGRAGRRARAVRRPALQGRDHRAGAGRRRCRGRHRGRRRGHGRLDHQRLPQHARVRRPVPRSARRQHRAARSLQADEGRRCVLAGQRARPDAAAHLRHGVGVQGRAGRPPAPAGGGREARPPAPRGGAGSALVPVGAGRRPGRVAPEGRRDPQADGGLQPGPARGRRLRVRLQPAPRPVAGLPDVGTPRLVQGEHVPGDGHGQRVVPPEAHELPDPLPDLPQPDAQLPGAAAAPLRAGHGLPLRAGGHAARPVAHPRLHAGRQPHLLHARAGAGRDPQPPQLRDLGAAGLRVRGLRGQPLHPRSDEVDRLGRRLGERHRDAARRARWPRASATRSRRATPPSTGPRSTSTCGTPSAGAGSSRPSSTTSTCRRASSWSTWGPTTSATSR